MFKYITKRPLWVNIAVGLGIVIAVFVVFVLSLNWITHHGESRSVPSVTGKPFNEAEQILEKEGFELVVQDSVYYDSLPPAAVMKQIPDPDAVVKVNRTVYVTINRYLPPEVQMPNLVGPSFRHAEVILRNLGLVLGDTTYRPDFARNSVLEQLYNGKPIAPGSKIRLGSTIDLVLGAGVSMEDMAVPKLIGMTFAEAKVMLDASGLVLGAVIADPEVTDNESAFVYRQSPPVRNDEGRRYRIRQGQMIDLFLSVQRPVQDTLNVPPPVTIPDTDEDY